MEKKSILLSIGLLFSIVVFSKRNPDYINYIDQHKDISITEMERSGIPASIKLAQAILESNAGRSVLARKAKNHFGIKCGPNWDGKTFYREDDDFDDAGNLVESCFRVYRNAQASFIAHSEFLTDSRKAYRYGPLFRLDPKDYRQWAYGLKRAGYATNPNYPQLLIKIIEDYELFQYDDMLLTPSPNEDLPPLLAGAGIMIINDAQVLLAENGDTPEKIADRTDISVKRILKYNELLDSNNEKIPENSRVFLQRKRNFYRGRKKWHIVQAGQTMFDISQLYGIALPKLYKKNRLEDGSEPAVGERIKLRWKVRKNQIPRLRSQALLPAIEEEEGNDLELDETDDISTTFPIPSVTGKTEEPYKPSFTSTINPGSEATSSSDGPVPTSGSIKLPPVVGPSAPPAVVVDTTPPSDPIIPAPEEKDKYYQVSRGDTLYSISKKYGTSVETLKRLNNLVTNVIQAGWMLRIE